MLEISIIYNQIHGRTWTKEKEVTVSSLTTMVLNEDIYFFDVNQYNQLPHCRKSITGAEKLF